jgi:hypothetical protein
MDNKKPIRKKQMIENFENPFSDYGNIISGKRFIGREASIDAIKNRILRPKDAGNLAIIGEPRIGKSSLVNHTVMEHKKELISKNIIPIWINVATFKQSSSFFRALVTDCYDELEDLDLLTKSIKKAKKRAIEDESTWNEGYSKIQRFFKKIRQEGLRILFILDEFDHARYLFMNDISGFQGLRELAYRPEWRVTFITTSRRTIREIEEHTHAISTFDGIFQKHFLGMFNEIDLQEYFSRLDLTGVTTNQELKEQIDFYCGNYPYLLEMIGFEIIETFRKTEQVDFINSVKKAESSLYDQYDRMISLMQEDNSFSKLLQILIGPIIDVKQTDVDTFLRHGLIKSASDRDYYQAFSTHFHEYLKIIEREVDLWPIWKKTELALRHLITSKMTVKYGDQWLVELEKSQTKLKRIFDSCRSAQAKEKRSFGNRASQNLIDFTYPSDLFAIMFAEWKDVFSSVLRKDKNYWDQRAQLLSKVRNPLAHSRDSVLAEHERYLAEGYCKEILAVLE